MSPAPAAGSPSTGAHGGASSSHSRADEEMSRNGHHAVTFDSGNTYTGAWRDGKMHGHGIHTWANGDRYTGALCDGKRHGHGTFTWADGNRYTGAFCDDKQHSLREQGTSSSACARQVESKAGEG